MPGKGEAIAKFGEKLEKLEKKTGCMFEIAYPKFSESVETNRLYADWYEPGTVIARAVKGNTVIVYDIAGELDAHLIDPDGQITDTFSGQFRAVTGGPVTITSDKDLAALNDGTDPSGYRLMFGGNNILRVSLNTGYSEPLYANDPSVARGLLNEELLNAAFEMAKEKEAEEALLPEALREAGKPKQAPEPASHEESDVKPFEAVQEDALKEDVPEPEKPAKKQKKTAKETKKAVKSDNADAEGEARFDLMPLDLVGTFLQEMKNASDRDFLKDIEAFKLGERSLLDAAMSFAKGIYSFTATTGADCGATDAIMDLAVQFGKDAEANGEDAWKSRDVKHYINEAVREYLVYLRDGGGVSSAVHRILFALFCGAWVAEH